MTGRLNRFDPRTEPEKHTHLIIKFDDFDIRFNDIRRFGFVDYAPDGRLRDVTYLNKLGPDPFELDEKRFVDIIKSRKRIIKPLLLDQEVISGLGNIYSDEALFKAGIKPLSNSFRISKSRIERLYHAVIEVLNDAINARGSSISDYVDGWGTRGNYQNYHSVYGRDGQPCPKCGTKIKRVVLGGRSAHFCPRCQR
jgi:formamidopyrimidine-DNA glycosylase